MICRKCGAQIKDGSFFCPSCGADLSQSEANQTQQTNQNSYTQNQYNYNQNQQFNQGGYNSNQQFNQNGYNRPPITERNIVVCILLSIITCGIYNIIWYIGMVDDLNAAADEPNATSGGMVFLLGLITCGIYSLYWMYKAGELMNAAKYKRGMITDNNAGILYLALTLFGFGIVSYCLIQNDLNKLATM